MPLRNESPVTNREPPMSQEGLDASYAAIREGWKKTIGATWSTPCKIASWR